MSDDTTRGFAALVGLTLAMLGSGCAAPGASGAEDESAESSATALGEAATLTFGADFTVKVVGTLERGKKIRVAYDESRLTACRGEQYGKPAWSITGYWRLGDGEVHAFEAGGMSPSGGTEQPVFVPEAAGDLQLWFQNNNRWGCNAYDSSFGSNYHFTVQPAAGDPGWLGNVRTVVSRQTCNGPCEQDLRPFDSELLYDTWSRERAAIRSVLFEAWKEGVTDFDNPSLWQQLDVQVHSRVVGAAGAFRTAYVGFDRRLGNNARYAHDLRALDPLASSSTIQNVADCPAFPLSAPTTNGGAYVEATVELYFTVNGVQLRPAPGAFYRVRFQNYRSAYAVCLH